MSEKDLQKTIIRMAQALGFRVAHFAPSLSPRGNWMTAVAADGAGFPDLVLVGRNRILFVEVKLEKGRVSDAQHMWLDALKETSAEVYVWRPSDLDAGTIEKILRLSDVPKDMAYALGGMPLSSG